MDDYTDFERLEFLEKELRKERYTGRCVFRISARGIRLHETSLVLGSMGAKANIREAIDYAIKKGER